MARTPDSPSHRLRHLLGRACAAGLLALAAASGASADDGDMDFSFGLFGRATRGDGAAKAIVAREDGSLRIAFDRLWHFGVLALEENGSIDHDFGDDGVAMIFLPAGAVYSNSAVALFERPDGELLVVANTDDYRKVAVAQLTPQGDPDVSFGTDGVRYLTAGTNRKAAWGAALQNDGKVVIAGECFDCGATSGTDTFLARLTATGGTDTAFGTNGTVVFDAVEGGTDTDKATAVAIDDLGRIVVGGSARTGADERPYVARRFPTGSIDTTFAGSDGIRTLTALAEQEVVSVVVEPRSHRPIAATGDRSWSDPPDSCAVARLTSTGALDTAFSGDGIAPLTFEEGTNLHRVLLQSDGKIVVAGSIDADLTPVEGFFVARLLANGTLDTSYDDDGRKRVEFDLDTNGRDAALTATLAGGRLVAAGYADEGDLPQIALIRTESALVFTDGFERLSTAAWLSH